MFALKEPVKDDVKFHIAKTLPEFGLHSRPHTFLMTSIHGVKIRWKFFDWQLTQDFASLFPSNWVLLKEKEFDFEVTWVDPKQLGMTSDLWEDSDPNCRFSREGDTELVIQRDFLLSKSSNEILLVADYETGDGINNFLRWLLPRRLLEKSQILLHSSAVIDERGFAHVSLGKSGAGKTTISSFATKGSVLGDDMNLLTLHDHKWLVEPAAVGQAIQERDLLGKGFEIAGFYLLEKAEANELQEIPSAQAFLELSTGLANLFWEQLEMAEVHTAQALIRSLLQQESFYRLKFNRDGKVWDYVHSQR